MNQKCKCCSSLYSKKSKSARYRCDVVMAFGRAKITPFEAACIDDEFLQYDAVVNHPHLESVITHPRQRVGASDSISVISYRIFPLCVSVLCTEGMGHDVDD